LSADLPADLPTASLYVPATHPDLPAIAHGDKLPDLHSVIFCTEDSVAERELSYALFNLSLTLQHMPPERPTRRFVRVRNPEVLARVLAMPGVDKLSGFVLPKITRHNFHAYFEQIGQRPFALMPTLETIEVFDEQEMQQLRLLLQEPQIRPRIMALRIGGNDLLALLGLRRPRHATLYQTPIGALIARLVCLFRPHGFALTAPVFEHLDQVALLAAEVQQDLAHGLSGKSAIHPEQIGIIERQFRVSLADVEVARKILDPASPAVFRLHDSMCEVATLKTWAGRTLAQARMYGVQSGVQSGVQGGVQSGVQSAVPGLPPGMDVRSAARSPTPSGIDQDG
jgi:citrate lyase beta subunit